GGSDIHESSLDLQQMVRRVYLDAATEDEALRVIDCSGEDGSMASPATIFGRIEQVVAPLLTEIK
ncbi:MAG: thymidylate kinase, partial [Alistipes sp.]|nr:thymidylate kinase [Alistipes sp.]